MSIDSYMDALSQIRRSWPVIALCAFYIYLAFHALSGSQGLLRWVDYEQDIVRYTAELETLRQEKAALEQHAKQLSAESLNLDALDIKAREYLYMSRADELTLWLPVN